MPKKCPICSEYITKDQKTIPFKDRTAHLTCFNSFIKVTTKEKAKQAEEKKVKKTSKAKPTPELKDGLTEEEYKEKQQLLATIRKIQCSDEITAKTYKLISDYMKNYKFTFSGISQSLEYYYVIQGNLASNDIIGIVPYIYNEAMDFYALSDKTLSINEGVNLEKINALYVNKIVRINPKKPENKLIDIESLGSQE